MATARRGSHVPRRAQADRRRADVQNAGPKRTLQPFRRSDRVSDPRQTFVHVLPGRRCIASLRGRFLGLALGIVSPRPRQFGFIETRWRRQVRWRSYSSCLTIARQAVLESPCSHAPRGKCLRPFPIDHQPHHHSVVGHCDEIARRDAIEMSREEWRIHRAGPKGNYGADVAEDRVQHIAFDLPKILVRTMKAVGAGAKTGRCCFRD